MFFCDKCNYIFDLTQESNISNIDLKKMKKIASINSLIKKILDENSSIDNYLIEIDLEVLKDDARFKKLSDVQKDLIITHIQKYENVKVQSDVHLKCTNCSNTVLINETILLFQNNENSDYNKIKINNYDYFTNDPTLPRTHDYICKNNDCVSNKKGFKGEKEAVFIREPRSFNVTYICSLCKSGWNI
jgi:hypothetical protein